MTREELINKMININIKIETIGDWDEMLNIFDSLSISVYCRRLESGNIYARFDGEDIIKNSAASEGSIVITSEEFLSWFKEEKPKQKLLNKREKLEGSLKHVKKQTEEAFKCTYDGRVIGEYVDGEYSTCSTCSPEEIIVFAKWVLDLEGE